VLVAEDDPLQREVLQELLTMLGFRSRGAGTPGEVVAALHAGEADVLLLDLRGMATARVRAALAGLACPPALVIVSGDPDIEQEAARLGADACLPKPFGLAQLMATLADVTASARGAARVRPAALARGALAEAHAP
jgi:CheY-like chemotaxis protein